MNAKSMSVVFASFALLALGGMAQSFQPHWDSPYLNGLAAVSPDGVVAKDQNIYSFHYRLDESLAVSKWNNCAGGNDIATVGKFYSYQGNSYYAGWINKMLVYGNDLYVVGSFEQITDADGSVVLATNIAKCNLTTGHWSGLSYPTNFPIWSIAIDNHTNVYVGTFKIPDGGLNLEMLMKYDGANWSNVGGGLVHVRDSWLEDENVIYSLGTDGTNIFAVGSFVGGYNGTNYVYSPCLIKWDGANWQSMGGLSYDGEVEGLVPITSSVSSICVIETNLFVAGPFSGAFDISNYGAKIATRGLAKFSTLTGSLLQTYSMSKTVDGTTFPGSGSSLIAHKGSLYFAGFFDKIGNTSANGIAKLNLANSSWSALGNGLTYNGESGWGGCLAANENAVLVSGFFDYAGNVQAGGYALGAYIARWQTAPDPFCPPVLSNEQLSGEVFTFDIHGASGTTWQVLRTIDQGTTDPIGSIWDNVGTVTLTGGNVTFQDSAAGSFGKCYYRLQNNSGSSGAIGFDKVVLSADGSSAIRWVTNSFYYSNSSINTVLPLSLFTGADQNLMTDGGLFVDTLNPLYSENGDISNLGDGWYWWFGPNWWVSASDVTFGYGESLQFYNSTGSEIQFVLHGNR